MVFMMGKQIREIEGSVARGGRGEFSDQRTGYVVVPVISDKDGVAQLDTIVQLAYHPR